MSFDSASLLELLDDEVGDALMARNDQAWLCELEAGTRSDLLEVLFEAARAPLVIIAGNQLVASNRAAKRLLEEMEKADVVGFLAEAPAARKGPVTHFVASPIGALRVTQWPVASRGQRVNVFVIETLGVDLDKLYSLAVATWKPTSRQSEVLWGILHGLSNKEIAQRLGTSHRTIEVHVSALLARAGVDGRSRLLTAARDLAGRAQLPSLRTARTER